MSSYAVVEFYNRRTGELLTSQVINQLKGRLEKLTPTCSIPEGVKGGRQVSIEYLGLVPNEAIVVSDFIEEEGKKIVKPEFLDKYKELKAEFSLNELVEKKEELSKTHTDVFYKKEYFYRGDWYSISSFVNARDTLEKEMFEANEKVVKLQAIKESVEYYKLSDDEKENLFQDIEWAKEDKEEILYTLYAYQYMINLMEDFVKDIYKVKYSDDIVVFIYMD